MNCGTIFIIQTKLIDEKRGQILNYLRIVTRYNSNIGDRLKLLQMPKYYVKLSLMLTPVNNLSERILTTDI